MKKIIAEDSDGNRFYIDYDESAPKENRYRITGTGVDIRACGIPQAMTLLRDQMRAEGRIIVAYA